MESAEAEMESAGVVMAVAEGAVVAVASGL